MKIMNYTVFTGNLSQIDLDQGLIINTINPHSYIFAKKDNVFNNALENSDILLQDGEGIVLAARILKNKKIKKISGYDLHSYLLAKFDKKVGRLFYLGASNKTLKLIKEKIENFNPNIIVDYYSPSFKDLFTDEDNEVMINKINSFSPNILFVGMTAPKQEIWVYKNKDNLDVKIICSIGAVFDFYAGTVKRVNNIWIKIHLEWFIRFLQEPVRLWKRNFISTPLFIFDLILYKFKIIKD